MTGALPQAEDVEVFLAIVDAGSISGASRALGLPKSTLSRRLARLEDNLGTRLFFRNRQRLQPTDTGAALVVQARRAVAELQALGDVASNAHAEPAGPLRVSAPLDLAGHADTWLEFMARYPKVHLQLELTNRHVDLLRDGFDIALRGGRGDDESMVARRVGTYELVAVASPEYLEQWGRLEDASDLRRHSCLLMSPMRHRAGHPTRPSEPHRHIVVNAPELAVQGALKGLGVAIAASELVAEHLEAGRLQVALESYNPLRVPLYAVYPDKGYLHSASRCFIEFAIARFG